MEDLEPKRVQELIKEARIKEVYHGYEYPMERRSKRRVAKKPRYKEEPFDDEIILID